ncbi:MAG TPA: hypothetical protein G4N95_06210 [Anaerolineae bacterium]|nr:hypothetical protein [Anaerolineae bacterium]
MIRQRFTIYMYKNANGIVPVQDYLFAGTNQKDISIMINVIQRLARVGQDLLDTNMAKPLGNNIYELRKDRHRILYAPYQQGFALLSAFLKKSQKTPPEEIKTAIQRYEQILEYNTVVPLKIPLD